MAFSRSERLSQCLAKAPIASACLAKSTCGGLSLFFILASFSKLLNQVHPYRFAACLSQIHHYHTQQSSYDPTELMNKYQNSSSCMIRHPPRRLERHSFMAIACPQAPAISYPMHENPNSQSNVLDAFTRQFLIVSPAIHQLLSP